ncbi:hypothetical protein [Rufibacter soli]
MLIIKTLSVLGGNKEGEFQEIDFLACGGRKRNTFIPAIFLKRISGLFFQKGVETTGEKIV